MIDYLAWDNLGVVSVRDPDGDCDITDTPFCTTRLSHLNP